MILGIDPGKSGAIILIDLTGRVLSADDMPETAKDIHDLFLNLKKDASFCYIENVWGRPGNGGSRAFNFGKVFGYVEMSLISCEIPYELVTPQKWQKEFQITKCENKPEFKRKLKEKAQQLFPKIKVTLSNCDALLIAEYGRRKNIK